MSLVFLKLTPELFTSVCSFAAFRVSCGMNPHSRSKDFATALPFKILTGVCTRIYGHVD